MCVHLNVDLNVYFGFAKEIVAQFCIPWFHCTHATAQEAENMHMKRIGQSVCDFTHAFQRSFGTSVTFHCCSRLHSSFFCFITIPLFPNHSCSTFNKGLHSKLSVLTLGRSYNVHFFTHLYRSLSVCLPTYEYVHNIIHTFFWILLVSR